MKQEDTVRYPLVLLFVLFMLGLHRLDYDPRPTGIF